MEHVSEYLEGPAAYGTRCIESILGPNHDLYWYGITLGLAGLFLLRKFCFRNT